MKISIYSLVVAGFLVAASSDSAGSCSDLSLDRAPESLILRQGARILLKVPLGKNDQAFLAGSCVLVRRNVRPTELFPEVDSLEVFQPSGERRVYRERDLGIRRLGDSRVLVSPDNAWAIVPDEEEGRVAGFFFISRTCSIREIAFPRGGTFSWKTVGGSFEDANTLLFPALKYESPGGRAKDIQIRIHRDGKFEIVGA